MRSGVEVSVEKTKPPGAGCAPAVRQYVTGPSRWTSGVTALHDAVTVGPRITGTCCAMSSRASWTAICGFDWSSFATNFTGRPAMPPVLLMLPSKACAACNCVLPMNVPGPLSARIMLILYGSAAEPALGAASKRIAASPIIAQRCIGEASSGSGGDGGLVFSPHRVQLRHDPLRKEPHGLAAFRTRHIAEHELPDDVVRACLVELALNRRSHRLGRARERKSVGSHLVEAIRPALNRFLAVPPEELVKALVPNGIDAIRENLRFPI